jgi:leader peptidase (prepilin peptidase)/N-methyltransferase
MAIVSAALMQISLPPDGPADIQSLTVFAIWFAFVLALIIVAMIDLEHYLIPDVIVLPGIIIGILANTFVLRLGYIEPIVSAGIAYAGLRLLFIDGYAMLTGRAGMGEGDAKLLAMFGAFLGYEGTLFALFAAAFQGLVIGLIMVAARRRDGMDNEPVFEEEQTDGNLDETPDSRMLKARVPFGPFLVLGAIEYLFIGDWILTQYTNLVAKVVYGI